MRQLRLNEVAQDILNIWGEDAEKICFNKAILAAREGDPAHESAWLRIRQEVLNLRKKPLRDKLEKDD